MDNGHGGGKYGKWEVSLRVPDPMGPGLLEQPGREEGGAEGLPAALWGAESGAGWRPGTGGGGVTTLAGTRQRDVGEFFCLIRFFGFLCMKGADWP